MANRVDPDQTPHSAASDLGLYCLQSLSVPILTVVHPFFFFFENLENIDPTSAEFAQRVKDLKCVFYCL